MLYLRDYMDRELYSSVPIHNQPIITPAIPDHSNRLRRQSGSNSGRHSSICGDPNLDLLQRSRSSSGGVPEFAKKFHFGTKGQSGPQQKQPLVHIVDFHKFPNALFMFLSDGTCQVKILNFFF